MTGAGASRPAGRGWLRLPRHLWTAARRFQAHQGFVLAGHLAFMGLLSLFPFLIFLVAVAGYLGQTEVGTEIVAMLLVNLPESIAGTLEQPIIEVMQETRGGLLTVGIIGAVWTASTGLESLRTALNRVYDVPSPAPYIRRRLESVLIVVAASAIIVTGMSAVVLGTLLWEDARRAFELPVVARPLWTAAQYGGGGVLLFGAVATLYWMLPGRRLELRWIAPGAALVLVLWLLAGSLFSLYLEHFNRYALTYGSLGGVVVAMVFLYILGAIFIFGAEVNAVSAPPVAGSAEGPAGEPADEGPTPPEP